MEISRTQEMVKGVLKSISVSEVNVYEGRKYLEPYAKALGRIYKKDILSENEKYIVIRRRIGAFNANK